MAEEVSGVSGYETLELEISRIQPYEHNPRHGRNPEYDRIKDSIRSHGLDQPLIVTQRPGDSNYIVHSGGNTRLLILNELYEETADSRFSRIQCLFKPWRIESDVLLAHLRENDLRGNLTFIDRARAVFEARRLLVQELDLSEITQRRLETELRRAGYRISQGLISQMEYAVDRLMPLIPLALENGLGRPQIERIRSLERAADAIWQKRCSADASVFDVTFSALCRRYDGPDWDCEPLRSALESEIAEEVQTSVHTIRVALDAELAGRELVIPEIDPEPEQNSEPEVAPARVAVQQESDDSNKAAATVAEIPVSPETEPKNEAGEEVLKDEPTSQPSSIPERTQLSPDNNLDPPITLDSSIPADLKSLRGRAWTLAARLGQRNGIGDLVEPLSGKGFGFILRDVPDSALAEQLDEEALSMISMLWWQLAACAEMTFAPLEFIVPELPEESVLRKALEEQDADLLFNSIWTLDPGHTGYRLWRLLSDRDWNDLLGLMDTYRRIRRLAADSGEMIWS